MANGTGKLAGTLSPASMNDHALPLRKDLADKVAKNLYEVLIKINPETTVLDIDAFTKARGYEPCISSVFIVSEGGSYDTEDMHVHNGTLSSWNNIGFGHYGTQYLRLLYAEQRKLGQKEPIPEPN